MQCPNCSAAVQAQDYFCEECGVSLQTASAPAQACPKCGATEIDPEGYCACCGFRQTQDDSDRLEVTIQPNLGGVSDRGIRHAKNEDFLALAALPNGAVLVVCDGVSSSQTPHLAARVAAAATCETIVQALQAGRSPQVAMQTGVGRALTAVCDLPYQQSEDADPPSTTLVAAIVQARTATIGWLGDSRAYWIAAQGSRQLTQDDSWVTDMVSSGQMTMAQAQQSTQAHAITRWLGADARDQAEPSLLSLSLPGPGYLLLCTDGLWNYASDATAMAALIQPSFGQDAITTCRTLVNYACSRGGHDNITVALLAC